jgi:hypothetical protein
MKNFKSFVAEEKPNIKRKAKGEQDFVDAHEVEITDPTDQGNNSAKVTTKANSGKHKNDRADNKQEFGEAVKKTYQVSGKVLAAKMRQIPSLKSFADKFENKPIVTPQMVDKILPDYISGGEITKLFKESVEDLDENPIVGAIARAAISSAVKKAVSSGSSNKEESVKPDVEKAFPASGVRKHNAPKGSSTMPKDKEKAKGQPAGSLKEEETQTYMVKFEKNGKVSLKNYEAKSDLDARSKAKVDAKRMGMTVASVRLKEEVEQIDELSKKTLKNYTKKAEKSYFDHQYHRDINLAYAKTTKDKTFRKGFRKGAFKDQQVMNKRRAGFDAAHRRMPIRFKEEVEQIEESQVLTVIRQKDGTHHVNVKTETGEMKHIGTIHTPDKEGVRVAKYKDGSKVAMSKDLDFLAKRLSGYHGKHMREEVEELDELKTSTLWSYRNKARDELDKAAQSKEMHPKVGERMMGMLRADVRTLARKFGASKYGVAKGYTKEEVEELDEEQLREFDLQTEAAYTNPGLERLAAAKKRNQPSHTNPGLEALAKKKKSLRQMKQEMAEADFSKKETKMAHTIGKEFEKKGVGDESQGGPYAIASAMVRDKPEAAQKAYKTIQSKMKEEADAELLFNLYNDLNEENQEMFMSQLEEDAESLLQFAKNFLAD